MTLLLSGSSLMGRLGESPLKPALLDERRIMQVLEMCRSGLSGYLLIWLGVGGS